MIESAKTKAVRQNAKKKYVALDRRSPRQPDKESVHFKRQQMLAMRPALTRQKKKERPLTEKEKKELLFRISEEKHPDLLKEQIELARRNGLEVAQKDLERLKKVEEARENLSKRIRKITGRQASAIEKEAVQGIKTGHVDTAMKQLAESGRDGAIGNQIADDSAHMAEDIKTISRETGEHKASVMQDMLFKNSAPIASINDRKDPEKKDQNLHGDITKDSTKKQISNEVLKKIYGAAVSH